MFTPTGMIITNIQSYYILQKTHKVGPDRRLDCKWSEWNRLLKKMSTWGEISPYLKGRNTIPPVIMFFRGKWRYLQELVSFHLVAHGSTKPMIMGETIIYSLLGTNISLSKAVLKMSFLFPRWDMLILWRVTTIYTLFFFWEAANFGTPQNPTTSDRFGGSERPVEAVALMASSSKWQEGIECCREFGSPKVRKLLVQTSGRQFAFGVCWGCFLFCCCWVNVNVGGIFWDLPSLNGGGWFFCIIRKQLPNEINGWPTGGYFTPISLGVTDKNWWLQGPTLQRLLGIPFRLDLDSNNFCVRLGVAFVWQQRAPKKQTPRKSPRGEMASNMFTSCSWPRVLGSL